MKIVNLETGTMEYPWERKVPLNTRLLPWWKRFIIFLRFSRKTMIDEDYYFFLPFEFQVSGYTYQRVYIKIPDKTIVDGASIPKIFRSLISPEGVLYIGAIFHDDMYKRGKITLAIKYKELPEIMDYEPMEIKRNEADALFFLINLYVTDLYIIDYLTYVGVRLFGWIPFYSYRRKEKKNTIYCVACGNTEIDGHVYYNQKNNTIVSLCKMCAKEHQNDYKMKK